MSNASDVEKLRALLPHWIEHNDEHAADFRKWAAKAGEAGAHILVAAEHLEAASRELAQAMAHLGGPSEHSHHHHHGHER